MEPDIQNHEKTSHIGIWLLDTALLANRVSLGLFFLLAGVGKLRMGVDEFYQNFFLKLKPPWLPDLVAWPYGHALPFVESAVGILLLIGLFGRMIAALMAALLISFSIALFGAGMFFSGSGPFHTNAVFITLAMLLVVTGPGRFSVDRIIWH